MGARQALGASLRLPLLGAAMLGTMLLGSVAAHAVSTTVVISEARFRGSAGASDELVELYNLSNAPVDISNYVLRGSNASGTTGARGIVPANTTLNPGRHFLFVGSAYNDGVAGDATMSGTTDDGGVALFLPDGTTVVDAVGFSAGSAYKEGTALTAPNVGTAGNVDRSYERKAGGGQGSKVDTDDNSSDFQLITPSTPQNLASPATPSNGNPTNPTGVGLANPSNVDQGGTTLLTVAVTPGTSDGTTPNSTGITVTGDLSGIGGSATQQFFDDGTNGDVTAGDNTFSYNATVAATTAPGSQALPITITDAQSRTNTASISLTVNQVFPASTTVVISEFRSRGAAGTADEFVELYNLSSAPVDISGYTLQYSSSGGSTPGVRATVPANVTLPAGQHYLLTANAGPLTAQGDANFDAFIADNGGVGLFDAAGNRVDAVGLAPGTQLKEGTALATFPTDNDAANRSYERLPLTVNNQDTQNNAADFQLTTSNPQSLKTPAVAPVANDVTGTTTTGKPVGIVLTSDTPGATYRITGGPTNGTAVITVNSDGLTRLFYRSNSGFPATGSATDTVTFVATNSGGTDSAPATATITVTAAAVPTANNVSGTVASGALFVATLTGSDSNGAPPNRYGLVTNPANGTASVSKGSDGVSRLYYRSTAGFVGTDTFQFRAVDNNGAYSDPATATITVTGNAAPTTNNVSGTVQSDTLLALRLSGTDSDGTIVGYKITRQPANGRAALSKGSDGVFVLFYRSNAGYTGPDSVGFVAVDNQGARSAQANAAITVTGTPASDPIKGSGGTS